MGKSTSKEKITLKEVYEKVITVQEKANLAIQLAITSNNRFAIILGLILVVMLFDIALHFYLHFLGN